MYVSGEGDLFQGVDQIEFADQAPFPGLLCDAVYFQFGRDPERQLRCQRGSSSGNNLCRSGDSSSSLEVRETGFSGGGVV